MDDQQQRMVDSYKATLDKFGPDDFRSLKYPGGEASVKSRYEFVSRYVDLPNSKFVEVGCGFGGFHKLGYRAKKYLGIEFMKELYDIAVKNKPTDQDIEYMNADWNKVRYDPYFITAGYEFGGIWDALWLAGMAGERGGPMWHPSAIIDSFDRALQIAPLVIANFPSTWTTCRHETIEYFSPVEILSLLMPLTRNLVLDHGLKKSEFFIIARRNFND